MKYFRFLIFFSLVLFQVAGRLYGASPSAEDLLIYRTIKDQHFIVVESKPVEDDAPWWKRAVSKLRGSSEPQRIDFRSSSGFEGFRVGLGARDAADIEVKTFEGSDGKTKFKVELTRTLSALGKYVGSHYVFDSEIYNIISVVADENRIWLLNADGAVFLVDRNAARRNFGLRYVPVYCVGKMQLRPGEKVRLSLSEGPFSFRDHEFDDETAANFEREEIVNSTPFLVRENASSQRLPLLKTDFISPQEALERAQVQEALLLRGVMTVHPQLAIAAGAAQAEIDENSTDLRRARDEAIERAQELFRRESAELVETSLRSVTAQLQALQENPAFELGHLKDLAHLKISKAAASLIQSLLSNRSSDDLMSQTAAAFEEPFAAALEALITYPSTHEIPVALQIVVAQVRAATTAQARIDLFGRAVKKAIDEENFDFQAWLLSSGLSSTTQGLLQLIIAAEAHEDWSLADQVVLAALFEWRQAIDDYVSNERNGHDKVSPQLRQLSSALASLETISTHPQLERSLAKLKKAMDAAKIPDWMALVGEARLEESAALEDWRKSDHAPLSLMERFKRSSFWRMTKRVGAQALGLPNMLAAAGLVGLEINGHLRGDQYPEGYTRVAQGAVLAFWGVYSLFRVGYWAWGRAKGEPDGTYRQAVLGSAIFLGVLSNPPVVRWWAWRGEHNALAAAKAGLMPTPENGGLRAPGESLNEARVRLNDVIDERNRIAVAFRDIAYRAVLEAETGTSFAGADFPSMVKSWTEFRMRDARAKKDAWDSREREAILSADPEKIAEAQAKNLEEQLLVARDLRALDARFTRHYEIVFHKLQTFAQRMNITADVLAGDGQRAFFAGVADGELKRLSGLSRFRVRAEHWLGPLRRFLGNRSAATLFLFDIYFNSSRERPRPDIARQNSITGFTDLGSMAFYHSLLDLGWLNRALQTIPWFRELGIAFPSRNDPTMPSRLFGQADGIAGMHPMEAVTLANQLFAYLIAIHGRANFEFGSIAIPENRYRVSERVERPFVSSMQAIAKRFFQWRQYGGTAYWNQSFKNIFRFMQVSLALMLLPNMTLGFRSGLAADYGMTSEWNIILNLMVGLSTYAFFSGWAMFAYGWPWIPIRNSQASLTREGRLAFQKFSEARSHFSSLVGEGDWAGAKMVLAKIVDLYAEAGVDFEPFPNWKSRVALNLSPEELVHIQHYLHQAAPPAYTDLSAGAIQTMGLVGAVATTIPAIPFGTLAFQFPLDFQMQFLIGVSGWLTQWGVISGLTGFEAYLRDHRDIKTKPRELAARILKSLEDPRTYVPRMSAYLVREIEKDLHRIAKRPENERADALRAASEQWLTSSGRLLAHAEELGVSVAESAATTCGEALHLLAGRQLQHD